MVTKLFAVSLCRESRHIIYCQNFFLIIMRGLFARTSLSVCTFDSITLLYLHVQLPT
jgi:hypothetical protein